MTVGNACLAAEIGVFKRALWTAELLRETLSLCQPQVRIAHSTRVAHSLVLRQATLPASEATWVTGEANLAKRFVVGVAKGALVDASLATCKDVFLEVVSLISTRFTIVWIIRTTRYTWMLTFETDSQSRLH